MAFSARRSLATSLSRHLTRRLHPSLSHLLTRREDPSSSPAPPPPTLQPSPPLPFSDHLRRRSRSQTLALPIPFGAHRSFFTSSSPGPEADAAAGVPLPSDDGAGGGMDAAAGVLSDTGAGDGVGIAAGVFSDYVPPPGMASQMSIASFAADWFPPVAALQHVLEAVHSFTGLNWWTTIMLTTVLLRTSEELVLQPLANRYGVKLKRTDRFINLSISLNFCLAILDMVQNVPSFQGGGAYWFTDLTTRDSTFILQTLSTVTLLAHMELGMRYGTVKNRTLQARKVHWVLLVMITPFVNFPKVPAPWIVVDGWRDWDLRGETEERL